MANHTENKPYREDWTPEEWARARARVAFRITRHPQQDAQTASLVALDLQLLLTEALELLAAPANYQEWRNRRKALLIDQSMLAPEEAPNVAG